MITLEWLLFARRCRWKRRWGKKGQAYDEHLTAMIACVGSDRLSSDPSVTYPTMKSSPETKMVRGEPCVDADRSGDVSLDYQVEYAVPSVALPAADEVTLPTVGEVTE